MAKRKECHYSLGLRGLKHSESRAVRAFRNSGQVACFVGPHPASARPSQSAQLIQGKLSAPTLSLGSIL